jgi:hypothetical protein
MPEGGHNPISDDRREVGRHAREGIEADRPLDVGGVEVDEIICAPAGDMVERGARKIAMRVEQRDAGAALEVLAQQVKQQ